MEQQSMSGFRALSPVGNCVRMDERNHIAHGDSITSTLSQLHDESIEVTEQHSLRCHSIETIACHPIGSTDHIWEKVYVG